MHQVLTENLYSYARENLALVNIYIKQPVVTKILRDQRIPVIWFVANCGGILGLCMGFSIVTVFEVLHCLTNVTFSSLANWYRNVRIHFWDINIFSLYKKCKTIKELYVCGNFKKLTFWPVQLKLLLNPMEFRIKVKSVAPGFSIPRLFQNLKNIRYNP